MITVVIIVVITAQLCDCHCTGPCWTCVWRTLHVMRCVPLWKTSPKESHDS